LQTNQGQESFTRSYDNYNTNKKEKKGGKKSIVDVHSHVFMKKFLKELEGRSQYPILRRTGRTRRKEGGAKGEALVIQFNERTFSNPISESFFDFEKREKELSSFGIEVQVLSGTNPWVDAFPNADLALKFSKIHNDELSEIVEKSKGRFVGLATLPLLSPEYAAEELERSIEDLGLSGAIIGTNVKGRYISEKEFAPVFEKASKLGRNCFLFLHPSTPLGSESLKEFGLVRSLGYPFETTTCLVKMAYSGILDRFQDLKVLSAHLAGALPYLSGRVDAAWSNFLDSKGSLNESPIAKIKRVLYADTISYSGLSLRMASEFLGIERLLFGTDYPFEWGVDPAMKSVEKAFCEDELLKIYSENFSRLLPK
jgi:aminocarboxymuconate-semialdehyde decarboxylase